MSSLHGHTVQHVCCSCMSAKEVISFSFFPVIFGWPDLDLFPHHNIKGKGSGYARLLRRVLICSGDV